MLDCDLGHRRSGSLLCMLYKIRCNAMHLLYGALPVPYVPVRGTLGALVAHRYTYAPPRYRSTAVLQDLFPLSFSLRNDLDDPVLYVVGLAGF